MAQQTSQQIAAYTIPMSGPSDISGLEKLISDGEFEASDVIAILGKTEGNGLVNDFTRGYTTLAFALYLSEALGLTIDEVEDRIAFVMSGGTEGVLSPHATIFTGRPADGEPIGDKRLAVSVAFTRDFLPEEIGTAVMAQETAATVRQAMTDAGIEDAGDVHFVQIKCPLLTSQRIDEAHRRGQRVATEDTKESMNYSRGASALGVAMALGEVAEEAVTDDAILTDWGLYSTVASTSAGIELMRNVIILMGNSATATSRYVIGHGVMRDAIDAEGVREALEQTGITVDGTVVAEADRERIVNVLAKAEASPDGLVRDRRHTMLNDSDVSSTRHARAVVGAVIAGLVGDPMVYVSGGAEHQGPAGGGPVAVIARVS